MCTNVWCLVWRPLRISPPLFNYTISSSMNWRSNCSWRRFVPTRFLRISVLNCLVRLYTNTIQVCQLYGVGYTSCCCYASLLLFSFSNHHLSLAIRVCVSGVGLRHCCLPCASSWEICRRRAQRDSDQVTILILPPLTLSPSCYSLFPKPYVNVSFLSIEIPKVLLLENN